MKSEIIIFIFGTVAVMMFFEQAMAQQKPSAQELSDLEASFGGSVSVSASAAVTSAPKPSTSTKKTGFYYLVDWNSFLDIDDTKGKHVNLRFQPKIGDPKRFYSVTVP